MFSLRGQLYMLNARSTLLMAYAGQGRWRASRRRLPLKLSGTAAAELACANPPGACVLYHPATGNVFLARGGPEVEFLTRGPASARACLACAGDACTLFAVAGPGANPLNASCRPVRLDLRTARCSALGCEVHADPLYAAALRGRLFALGLQRGPAGAALAAFEVCGPRARPLPVRDLDGTGGARPGPLPCARPLLRLQAYDRYALLAYAAPAGSTGTAGPGGGGERCRLLLIDSAAEEAHTATVRDLGSRERELFRRLRGDLDGVLWRGRFLVTRSGWLELPESILGLLRTDHLAGDLEPGWTSPWPGAGDAGVGGDGSTPDAQSAPGTPSRAPAGLSPALSPLRPPARRRDALDPGDKEPEEEGEQVTPYLGLAPEAADRLPPAPEAAPGPRGAGSGGAPSRGPGFPPGRGASGSPARLPPSPALSEGRGSEGGGGGEEGVGRPALGSAVPLPEAGPRASASSTGLSFTDLTSPAPWGPRDSLEALQEVSNESSRGSPRDFRRDSPREPRRDSPRDSPREARPPRSPRAPSPGRRALQASALSDAVASATAALSGRNAQLQSRVEVLEEALARQREANVAAAGRTFLLEERMGSLQRALDETRREFAEFRAAAAEEIAASGRRLGAAEAALARQAAALARLQALVTLGDDGRPREGGAPAGPGAPAAPPVTAPG